MKENVMYNDYKNVFNDDEILIYGLILDKFKNNVINFKQLKNLLAEHGITVKPLLIDFSKKAMTIKEAKEIQKRLDDEDYIYNDINAYVFNSDSFENVLFAIDYKVVEVLANHGEPDYVEAKRNDNIFTARGLITVLNNRITLNIHPTISGRFDTTVTIQEKRGGATVAQFDIDENGNLLDMDKQAEYTEYRSEIIDAMKLANEIFGDIFHIN